LVRVMMSKQDMVQLGYTDCRQLVEPFSRTKINRNAMPGKIENVNITRILEIPKIRHNLYCPAISMLFFHKDFLVSRIK